MADDYRVKGLSDAQVRAIARHLRAYYSRHITNGRVDVRACLLHGKVMTVRGEEALFYETRNDSLMGRDDGVTTHRAGAVTVSARASVDTGAKMGIGRDRQTLAHELAHAAMHDGPPMSRRAGATGKTSPDYIEPYRSAEHQAKVFAAAFLIDDDVAKGMSPEEISVAFGVSLESATIAWERLTEPERRKESIERVDRLVETLRTDAAPRSIGPSYVAELCSACGKATLVPIGTKFLCDTCGDVSDRFQDGDSVTP